MKTIRISFPRIYASELFFDRLITPTGLYLRVWFGASVRFHQLAERKLTHSAKEEEFTWVQKQIISRMLKRRLLREEAFLLISTMYPDYVPDPSYMFKGGDSLWKLPLLISSGNATFRFSSSYPNNVQLGNVTVTGGTFVP